MRCFSSALLLAGVAGLTALAACAGAPAEAPPATGLAADLPGSSWTVERIVEADGDLDRGLAETVAFGERGDLRITACNDCSGTYSLAEGVLTVAEGLACTKRACPAGAIPMGAILAGQTSLARDGAYLVLTNDSLNVRLLMVPAR